MVDNVLKFHFEPLKSSLNDIYHKHLPITQKTGTSIYSRSIESLKCDDKQVYKYASIQVYNYNT